MKSKGGIRRTLLQSHVGVAIVSLMVITILINTAIFVSFSGYVRNQLKNESAVIVRELEDAYTEQGLWLSSTFMAVSHRAMLRNYFIRIYDNQGIIIWDSTTMNGHMQEMGNSDGTDEYNAKISLQVAIMKEGDPIGKVWLGRMNGINQGQEKSFLINVNLWIWISFLLIMVGVYGFSRRLSTRISSPLLQIKETADRMTEGDLKARVSILNDQSEIEALGSALNHLAERLSKQEELRKIMTADIAHELRTPVTTVRSHIEAFQDGIWEPTEEKLAVCHQQILQLIHLIQDLEKLSEAENPSLQLAKEEMNLIAVLHEAQTSVQELDKEKHIHYIPPGQQRVDLYGDYRRCLQIFVNLIHNAYKYTPDNGTVCVQVSEEADAVTVCIRDNGLGIRPEELPHIFERFYRGEKSRNRKLGGAGIGLSVVKALVEAHGGTIHVESEIQTGSNFSVSFPRA